MSFDWRRAITENWPYKAASLVLAVLLWLNVTAEQGGEFSLSTRVEVQVADSGWVAVAVRPPTVETVFRGRRGIFYPQELPVVRQVIDSVTASEMRIDLSPRMVEGIDGDLNMSPVTVRPQTVEVRLEPRVSRKVAVSPRLELSAAEGFDLVTPALLQPESVTVRGPESEVSDLDSIVTERVPMEDLQRTVTRELQLERPDGTEKVSWSPTSVLVTVEVDSTAARSFAVPVAPVGVAAEGVSVEPSSVRVTVRGPAGLVGSLSPASVEARVVVDSLPAGEVSLPVEVVLPARSPLRATAEPPRVRLAPRRSGGSGGP